jgi:LPS-assembly protein
MDLTIGTQYFSKRGWSPSGEFRYHGREDDFGDARFTALFDRGLAPTFINEGGQDIVVNGRHDFDPDERTRAVANGEYLSSYVYRQSFAESFAQGIASQVQSLAFITHNVGGVSSSVRFDRYQNFEGMTLVGNTYDTPQISILRLPSLDFDTVDRAFGPSALGAALEWGVDGSAAGLSRSEPGYATGEVGRFDLYPHLSLPLHLDGWTLRPEVGARETYYTQSQIPTNTTPVLGNAPVNRSDLEASFELRPPALVRDFKAPVLARLFDSDLRHTIEAEIQYRFVAGINNFSSIPRFDSTDVVSDTNEVEYSLTQRLFFRHLHRKPCRSGDLPKPLNGIIYIPWDYTECGGDTNEWITWRLAAKYFFDPTFGGAIPPPQTNRNSILYATPTFLPFRRTVLTSALDLTGVAFLGEPRNDSPLISRFKARTSEHTDFEWDADYDFKNHRLDASNLFADYRRDSVFGSIGYSTLQALNGSFTSNSASQVTQYSLIRLLMGYGAPTKRGFSTAVNGGYNLTQDALQYAGIETSYNLDCCGLVIEYRRLVLGTVPTENEYRFSITLAGVGAAGNLAHSERIF